MTYKNSVGHVVFFHPVHEGDDGGLDVETDVGTDVGMFFVVQAEIIKTSFDDGLK